MCRQHVNSVEDLRGVILQTVAYCREPLVGLLMVSRNAYRVIDYDSLACC